MKRQIGFTLIEFMILIAIVGIVLAIVLPKFKVTASVSSTPSKSVPVEAVSTNAQSSSLTPTKSITVEECVNGFSVFVHPNGITQKMGIDGKPAVCIQ